MRSVCMLMALLATGEVVTAAEIAGTWRGQLQVDPTTTLTIDFIFTRKPDGQYSAVLNSPTSGAIRNVTAKAVSLQDDALKVDVPALSGSFSGTVKTGTIAGKWAQPGSAFTLVLSPYQAPKLSKADIDTIAGTWSGSMGQGVPLTFVLNIRSDDKSGLEGFVTIPEQGNSVSPIAEIEFVGGRLVFKLPTVQGEFEGTHVDGELKGRWKQIGGPPGGGPLTLKKGEVPAVAQPLKFTGSSFAVLLGDWQGRLKMKEKSLPLSIWFGTDSRAELIGFINSRAQDLKGVPVTDVRFDGVSFVAKASSIGAEYRGDLSGTTLKGEWLHGQQREPLTLTKK